MPFREHQPSRAPRVRGDGCVRPRNQEKKIGEPMKFVSARRALRSSAAVAALLYAGTAFAQETATAPEVQADNGDIVVTAQRREERLVDVPVSVAVVQGDLLRDFQAAGDDTLALAGRVPGLYAETTTGRIFPRYYIRGLGNIDFYLGASQPVSIIQDDVVLEHVVLKSNPVYDLDRVEVLRGPQGSLFGRNTTAGIVKFDTIRPSDTFQGRAALSVGEYGSSNIDVGFGGPIVDDVLSFRVSGLYQHRDDWVDNTYTGPSFDGTRGSFNAMGGFDDRNLRLQLRFTPTDRLTFDLSGHGRWYKGTSTLFHRGALVKGSNSVENEPRDRVAYDEAMDNPQAYNTYGTSLRASYDLGGAVLTSISAWETTSGYSRGDTDGGAAPLFTGDAFLWPVAGQCPRSRPVQPGAAPRQPGHRQVQLAVRRLLFRFARHHRFLPAPRISSPRRSIPPTPTATIPITGCACTTSTPAGRHSVRPATKSSRT